MNIQQDSSMLISSAQKTWEYSIFPSSRIDKTKQWHNKSEKWMSLREEGEEIGGDRKELSKEIVMLSILTECWFHGCTNSSKFSGLYT